MNNNTLAGWYSTNSGIKDYGGGILSLGPTDGGGDRALGAAGAVGGKVYIALRLQNLTTASISGVSVMFDGEEWYRRAQGNGPQVTSSLNFAFQGIWHTFCHESSFRTQLLIRSLALPLLIALKPSPTWWGILILTGAAVLSAELVNTSIELTIDRIHPQSDPIIKQAKDCAAGAVLMLSVASILVIMIFLWSHFWGTS